MITKRNTILEKSAKELAKSLKINFNDLGILENSLIHRSFLNEHRSWKLESNERLEFLGDAVLELIVTNYLFHNFSNEEGELTNWRAALVSAESLAPVAEKIHLEKYLFVGRGEQKNRRSKLNIMADAFEALIGAIYLDLGLDQAEVFIKEFIISKLPNILKNELFVDAKTALQEKAQREWKITPDYRVVKEGGPDHNKWFEIGVYINKKLMGKGRGSSKQKAEKEAAKAAMDKLDK
jgi:ribonuclease III